MAVPQKSAFPDNIRRRAGKILLTGWDERKKAGGRGGEIPRRALYLLCTIYKCKEDFPAPAQKYPFMPERLIPAPMQMNMRKEDL